MPRSGTLPAVEYEGTLPMEDFMRRRPAQNKLMLERVKASAVADRDVQQAFDMKAMEEIESGKAIEVAADSDVAPLSIL